MAIKSTRYSTRLEVERSIKAGTPPPVPARSPLRGNHKNSLNVPAGRELTFIAKHRQNPSIVTYFTSLGNTIDNTIKELEELWPVSPSEKSDSSSTTVSEATTPVSPSSSASSVYSQDFDESCFSQENKPNQPATGDLHIPDSDGANSEPTNVPGHSEHKDAMSLPIDPMSTEDMCDMVFQLSSLQQSEKTSRICIGGKENPLSSYSALHLEVDDKTLRPYSIRGNRTSSYFCSTYQDPPQRTSSLRFARLTPLLAR